MRKFMIVGIFKLLCFCGAWKRTDGGFSGCDGGGDLIKITCADKPLVLDRTVTALLSEIEFALLQVGVRKHAGAGVFMSQLEGGEVQCVEAGQGDELKAITHVGELSLKTTDLPLVEFVFPIEGRSAII